VVEAFGFSQGVEIEGAQRTLICFGQTPIQEDAVPPANPDMAGQAKKAFENFGTVLQAAVMSASNVVRVNYYTTDIDELVKVSDLERWGSSEEIFLLRLSLVSVDWLPN
jgi:enamine deaminase RidA (YjgF/YER057c/UK114 family)